MGEDEKGNAMSRISPSYVTGLEKYINELRNQVSSLKAELSTIRRIHAQNIALKDAEIARWKTVPMKYRRMEFNAQLQFEIAEQRADHMKLVEENHELRQQLAALKAELREICAAIDDPACDLTLTAVECIKKLKAENESLQKDAARLDWVEHQDFYDLSFAVLVDQPNDGMIAVSIGEGWHLGNNLREAIDAAIAKG